MRKALRFLHRGQIRSLENVDPNLTVLRFLREVDGLTGTKEGCAEGDCGACTVVLGELEGDKIRYRAANGCILFMPMLDGRELITAEDLASADGELHPVQQAMVNQHGSQCGFCTPGFVMSLFAAYHDEMEPDRAILADRLAGNLCRCTGYRPILDAGMAALARRHPDQFAGTTTINQIRQIAPDEALSLEALGRQYFAPVDSDELAALLLTCPDATIVAGATDVGLWVTKEHRALDTMIYTDNVRDMRTIAENDKAIDLGAAVTYSDAHDALGKAFPDMGELLRRLGGLQVRNAGTIGGNIANASPIGDTPPPLLALGASLVLRRGERRRELPLDNFFLDYRKTALERGEFVERVRVPKLGPGEELRIYKISKRFDQDISALCAAFWMRLDGQKISDCRLAYGGMAAIPKRARATEDILRGKPWSGAMVERAASALEQDFSPITDFRSSERYRRLAALNLLHRFHNETAASGGHTRVLEYA